MGFNLIVFSLLALALGFKHAFDADHLVAVSGFLTRSNSMRDTYRMTISWAIGHMVTAGIITILLFLLASGVGSVTGILSNLETAVGVMLIIIGAVGILSVIPIAHKHYHQHIGSKIHTHLHKHRFGIVRKSTAKPHLHHPLLGVGIVHGLASNDELLVLFVAGLGVGSLNLLLGGVAFFTVGVVVGMILFGAVVTYPLLKYGADRIRLVVNVVAGSLSIIYGFMILAGLGGVNLFELVLPA